MEYSKENIFSIIDAGAMSDLKVDCTRAIQCCIDRAAQSGGTVLIPKGRFLTGGLILRSTLRICLAPGAELIGTTDRNAYPQRALLFGESLTDLVIEGPGLINGQGHLFPPGREVGDRAPYHHPHVINLRDCRRVRIENLFLKDSAFWMQRYERCQHLHLRGVVVDNFANHYSDGMDIDGCQDVIISDCQFVSDDDALCFKTYSAPCERIVVSNCLLSSHCNAIKLGTESFYDFRDIQISNCVVSPSLDRGVRHGVALGNGGIVLTSMDGATIENISISNVTIRGTRSPLFIRLGDRGAVGAVPSATRPPGRIRGIRLSGIHATHGGTIGCEITAVPGRWIEDVRISDFDFQFAGGGPAEKEPKWLAPFPVPEKPVAAYPDPGMHGYLPCWGLFARRVRGLRLDNGRFSVLAPETRMPIIAEEVEELELQAVSFPAEVETPVVYHPAPVGGAVEKA